MFTAHRVCDGWSTAVVVREWAALYSLAWPVRAALAEADAFSAYARERRPPPPDRQRAAADDEASGSLAMPTTCPSSSCRSESAAAPAEDVRVASQDGVLDAEAHPQSPQGGRRQAREPLLAVLLAGFEVLLARLSGQEDVVVGVPAAGQSVGGHDGLVGHCVNMLPLRARVDPERPVAMLLGGAQHRAGCLRASAMHVRELAQAFAAGARPQPFAAHVGGVGRDRSRAAMRSRGASHGAHDECPSLRELRPLPRCRRRDRRGR